MKKKVLAVILAIVSVAALAACGSNGAAEPKADGSAATEKSSSTSADTTIKIGAKSFSESKILGELYALALEDAGYKVEREFEVSDNLIHQAVCDGQIDMYPEYTGTSLLTILDQPMETDPQITYDKVKEMYRALIKYKKFNFNKLFSVKKRNKIEVVTAFSGLLEMSRRNKVITEQEEIFGDIEVEKNKKV